MITTETAIIRRFNVIVARGNAGSVYVHIEREDGAKRTYDLPEKKLRVFASIDTTVKDATSFLLDNA